MKRAACLATSPATRDGSTWAIGPNQNQPLNAFEVTVAVPEPSCLAFALAGLALTAGRRRIFREA